MNRYDFALLFDVTNGNPNGDPDADNEPRREQGSEHGLVSDVCIKRKVRNFVDLMREHGGVDDARRAQLGVHITAGAVLNDAHNAALDAAGAVAEADKAADNGVGKGKDKGRKSTLQPAALLAEARRTMQASYFDVRTFGSVLANSRGNDSVTGPVQLSFARSIDPITTQRHTLTRCAATEEEAGKANKTMGGKWTVPYALYRAHGSISGPLADKAGFEADDLALLWRALADCWDHDKSAARGVMHCRALVAWEHGSALGNARASELHKLLQVERRAGVKRPVCIEDYVASLGTAPAGVATHKLLWDLREPGASAETLGVSHAA
ncbi:type I-C CRISPR-associated protein Cas7/Csd2 [Thiocapsa sp. UBA6158]|uniref:type I-C CRISPR-associated protein Cas7/Csd2 n=1 Tax=Thiocapsa sp. UBA6158 TaxID=1947692 RepID=UPI002601594A|nr:type I-C CRISPR-associated protein Cas7/Csd2 [Thiocapsa sp. UBA6158]